MISAVFLATNMSGSMKLTYFNNRGKGEITRLLFKLAGKDFIDNRVEREEWPSLKSSKLHIV